MDMQLLAKIIEAILLTAGEPVTYTRLQQCFEEDVAPTKTDLDTAIQLLQESYDREERSFLIKELAGGYVLQAKQEYAPYIVKLWEEKPTKYSRAYLETLVIVAYRQPVTRAEIEEIRGVAVSTSIMKTLQEREWIKVIGHRDVPGKPGLYGTTKTFLDYFNLKSLDELPTLKEIQDLDLMASRLQEQINFAEDLPEDPLDLTVTEPLLEQVAVALDESQPEVQQVENFVDEIEAALHELTAELEDEPQTEKELA